MLYDVPHQDLPGVIWRLSVNQCISFFSVCAVITTAFLSPSAAVGQTAKGLSPDQVAFVKVAKQNVVSNFRDPVSVQYRNVFISKTGETALLCGEINGKNVYGGYVGFRAFVGMLDKDTTVVGGEIFPPDLAQATKAALCKVKVADVE